MGISWKLFVVLGVVVGSSSGQEYGCPPQEKILPCRCSSRDMELQIWCSHSELPRVLDGLKAVSRLVSQPVDELVLENNNLPSLPGHVFASLRVLRLMLRNNRLERVSSGWLDGLHDSLLELFVVEPELRSLPVDSLDDLRGLEALTLQSKLLKRLPSFAGLAKLRYLQINSPSLVELSPRHFRGLGSLEQLHVFGSPRLGRLEAGLLRQLPRLQLLNLTDCGLHWLHPRALLELPELRELALRGNRLEDAAMLGRALLDLPKLSVLQLDGNRIARLNEGSFVDLPSLTRLSLSRNSIAEILPGAFQRVPQLRTLNLNHNRIHRIHPDFFVHRDRADLAGGNGVDGVGGGGGGGLEELWLMDNDIGHVAELRAVLDALPRLKFLEASHNHIGEIRFGALRGHSSLERLHLDYNRLGFIQRDALVAMPALRELRLSNNSLTNSPDEPFWHLPALKGLDLSGNFFRHIEPRLLANLPNLRRLDLSENSVSLVEPDAFMDTPALEHVNMSGNALTVLHPLTFRHLANLYELDVGWNRLLETIPGLPRSLEHLHLAMNRIGLVGSAGSLDLPLLRSLDLSANGIEQLAPAALSGLASLRRLDLGFNALVSLDDASFSGLARLESLDLKYNRISRLQPSCFSPLRSLLELSLRGNRLELLRSDVLRDNPRLQLLDLSRNALAALPHDTFAFTRELREVYASHNGLSELPSSLLGLESLQVLDLGFNKLTSLSPEMLSSLSSLVELKLARNRVRELREGAFDRLPRLALVDLEDNELALVERNAVRALPELQAIRLGNNMIQMIPSGAFSELPMLQSCELQENQIQQIASNAFINVPHLLFLNLSHNLLSSLDHISLDSLGSLEVLDLSDNRITRVSSENLAAMEWLVELNMDNNRICAIHGSPFDDMPRLRVLSLRSNRMASVRENAFKRLRSNIAVLDIDGNPLSCSCGMLWLRGWLQQASAEGPRCADGSLFREIRLSKQDCERERVLEPAHPGCEPDALGTASSSTSPYLQNADSSWSNAKKSPSRQPGSQETEYLYDDYDDYPSNSSAELSNSVSIVTPQSAGQKLDATLPPPPPAKRNPPSIPPSPSTSGFTFFGVPLPSLNFNLWGNAGKKAERKEDGSIPARPGRGRYRNFPPTEPEIHRGGFMPLPRGQGGFVPIADPSFQQQQQSVNESTEHALIQRNNVRTTNYTVGKVERTTAPLSHNNSAARSSKLRQPTRDESSAPASSTRSPVSFVRKQQPKKQTTTTSTTTTTTTTPTTVAPDSAVEADEALASTELYSTEEVNSDELNSRIVWSTQRPINASKSSLMVKETVTASVHVGPPSPKATSADYVLGAGRLNVSTTTAAHEPDIITTDNASIMEEVPVVVGHVSLGKPSGLQEMQNPAPQASRNMEASALSALLVPGGQVPTVGGSGGSIRPAGRSTITKVPSPYYEQDASGNNNNKENEKLVAKEDNHLSGSSLDEAVKLVDDAADFNWYFKHYNDTDLDPYVGVVYGSVPPSATSTRQVSVLLIQFLYFLRYLF